MALPLNSLNNKPENKKNGYFNIVLFILLVISVICISFLVYLKSQNIDIRNTSFKDIMESFSAGNKDSGKSKTWEIKYDYSEHHVFAAYDGLVIECSKNSIRGLNKNEQEQWVEQITVNNPLLKTAGEYLLVGDMGGKEIYLFNGKSVKWNKRMDGNIVNIDITDEGYISVLNETSGYRGMLTVFNRNGNVVLSRTVLENFPLLARVSPSGKRYVISCISSMGIQAETGLIFGKLSSKEDTEITPQKEQLFPFAWYLNSDLLCTVSHSSVMCFDQDGKTAWENQFDENQVYCADISEGKHLVMVLRDDAKSGSTAKGDKTLVRIYDKEGKVYGESSIEGKVKNIKTYGSMIAVNAGREIYVISPKGKILDKCSSKTDVSELFFIDGKNLALVTNSKIIINQINS